MTRFIFNRLQVPIIAGSASFCAGGHADRNPALGQGRPALVHPTTA
jgi:hypothetical protein